MNKILTMILILLSQSAFSQHFDWAFGGGQWVDDDISESIIDKNNNVYITGHNGASGANIGTYVLNSWGVYIAKFDSLGSLIWVVESDGDFDTHATGITIDYNDNLYITGYYTHSISFGNFFLKGASQPRMFIVKISSTGNIIWAKDFGTISDTDVTCTNGITIDKQNNIYLAGGFKGTVKFSDFELVSKIGGYWPEYDIFIVKLNEEGNCVWAKRAGGRSEDFAYDIAIGNDDNLYITGVFSPNNADFGNIEPTLSNTSLCEFTAKYNTNGDAVWIKAGNQMSNTISEATCLAIDKNGFIYSMGNLYGTIVISKDTLSSIGYNTTNYLVKYNAKGDIIETKGLNNSFRVISYSIGSYKRKIGDLAIDNNNSLFIASSYTGNIENNDFNLFNSENNDLFVAKYNDIGYFQWVKKISGSGNEMCTTLSVKNRVIIGGNYSSQQLVLDSSSITNYSGNDDDDFFIASLSDTTQIKCPKISTSINSNQDYICSNGFITMTYNSKWGYNFDWYCNNILDNSEKDSVLITNKPGSYYVIVNPFSICSDTTYSIYIEKITTPSAHIKDTIVNSTYFLYNELNDSSFSYKWYYNDDYSNIISNQDSIMVPVPGTYNLSVENSCGIIKDDITIDLDDGISVYPNPNNGHLNLTVSNLKSEQIILYIYDIKGKKILEKNYKTNSNYMHEEMLINKVKTGMYFIVIKTEENLYSKKIQIIKHN